DFNLNYDDDPHAGPLDMGGPGQLQKLKDFFTSAMEDLQEMPKVVDAANQLGLENTNTMLPGLEVKLMPHQLIGVSWMLEQEAKPAIRGGILADDMGLGKTLQCIATCVKNRPEEGAERKSTLIVAPAALLEQWKAEITQRTTEGMFKVHIHHGKEKFRRVDEVRQYDIVITTYQTLYADFPKKKKVEGEPDDDSSDEDIESWGPLAKTAWHRVVLDEAQCIRNRATRSSKCVARLTATYRWALTGTPVTNSLSDLYGLIRFLQFPPFNDWKEFNLTIAKIQSKNPTLAGKRAQALLKQCLLRRNKDTKLEDKFILQLPPKHIEVVEIDFSTEEREIYLKIEKRQQMKMTKFLKAGTVMKKYVWIVDSLQVMLLRLRQACKYVFTSHGWSCLADLSFQGTLANAPLESELERAERLLSAQFVQEVSQSRILAEQQGAGAEEEDCPICFDTYVNNCRITKCKHLFCADCLNDLFKNAPTGLDAGDAAYQNAIQSGIRSCPVCRGNIHPNTVFKTAAFEPSEEELSVLRGDSKGDPEVIDLTADSDDEYVVAAPAPDDIKGKGKEIVVKAEVKSEASLEDILGELDRGDNFEPSAKMRQMMVLIKQCTGFLAIDQLLIGILASTGTSMITLVEKLLVRDNIQTVRYDGKMSRSARHEAVAMFKKRKGPPVMLISLKCGGVGLNLVEANRVISLDLAWNAATENQAFDRVYRMGKQKDVHVKRLIIRNTVEERILNLQATKQSLADSALGEGKAQKIKKMTVGELKVVSHIKLQSVTNRTDVFIKSFSECSIGACSKVASTLVASSSW
ncbi:SNF2 family N-terminal domain-containing protein, partial [Hysterangium stoloniferum]